LFINTDIEVLEILNSDDLVWLDGYHFTEELKVQIRSVVFKLIETNDIPYEAKNVDIIFNHTPGIIKSDFRNTKAQLFLGLDYAMLRSSFLEYAKTSGKSVNSQGVFICFGGADTYNLGEKFVDQLLSNNFNDPIYWVTNSTDTINRDNHNVKNLIILNQLNEIASKLMTLDGIKRTLLLII
jgi:spore coat polysaccharide biosynthesis predicted glycosyltransferase SpsG